MLGVLGINLERVVDLSKVKVEGVKKKRYVFAAGFMAVAIAAAVPLGINTSLSRLREDAAMSYHYDQAGYSIYDGLELRRAAANDLITLAEKYREANPELSGPIDALDYRVKAAENAWSDDDTYQEEYAANAVLDTYAQDLANALQNVDLSERDQKYPAQIMAQMKSEQDKINRSSYNTEAEEFNQKLERLEPMALLKPMAVFSAPASQENDGASTVTEAVERADTGVPAPEAPAVPGSAEEAGEIAQEFADNMTSWARDFADGITREVTDGIEQFLG